MNNRDQMHPDDMRNLILFMILSIALWAAYDLFILKPQVEKLEQARKIEAAQAPESIEEELNLPRDVVVGNTKRVAIKNDNIFGSINLKGARIDDIGLSDYHKTIEGKEPVHILSPSGSPFPKYVEFGWVSGEEAVEVPDKNTVWKLRGNDELKPGQAVTLSWSNGKGITFERAITVDENFVFSVTQKLINKSGKEITVFPYALIAEHGLPEEYFARWITHEGPIGYVGDELFERNYKKMAKEPIRAVEGSQGWIGITEKYWLTALIPAQGENAKYRFIYSPSQKPGAKDRYQVDVTGQPKTIANGKSTEVTTRVFVGAKKVETLMTYERDLNIPHFDLAVDFGLFYFLTRPFFYVINLFYHLVGNFGIAIIMFTVCLRIAVFPLANTSFKSFAKLRQVGPQMYELREKYGEDKQKLQQELVKLYQKEKVNPMAGCLPILVQIPIFFALFKVLSNTIEMRHQPFFGWIQDLSAPDPTSLFNLFGLLPYDVPGFLMIGVWPFLMFLSMLAQRRLSPPVQDPMQAKMLAIMPYIICFILAKFAAGLVIYWTFNNILSILQQYIIMRRMGVEVSFFHKTKDEKKLDDAVAHGPAVHPAAEMIEDEVEEALHLHDGDGEKKEISKPKPKKKRKKK